MRNPGFTTKLVVATFLAVAMVAVPVTAGMLSTNHEQNLIQEGFGVSADQLMAQIRFRTTQSVQALASVGSSLTSTALTMTLMDGGSGPTFPFVTDPFFAVSGGFATDLGWAAATTTTENKKEMATSAAVGTNIMFWSPLVAGDQKEEWETYSVESYQAIQKFSSSKEDVPADDMITPHMFEINEKGEKVPASVGNHTAYCAPIWQMTPTTGSIPSKLINLNLRSIPSIAPAMDHVVEHQKAVITPVLNRQEQVALGLGETNNQHKTEDQVGEEATAAEPMSLLLVPVFDTLENITARKVVGTVLAPLFWRNLLLHVEVNLQFEALLEHELVGNESEMDLVPLVDRLNDLERVMNFQSLWTPSDLIVNLIVRILSLLLR